MGKEIVLIDTSVWVDYLKYKTSERTDHLDTLLVNGSAAICAPVKAEVISGARSSEEYRKFVKWFNGFSDLAAPTDIWHLAAESRFQLARKGNQQQLIDLWIAHTAYAHNVPVWSLDDDFTRIAQHIPFKIYSPPKSIK